MHYKCDNCGTDEWRGYFPQMSFHLRYTLFHGSALGISAAASKTPASESGL